LKQIISELDKIAKYIEDFEEPWAFNLVWRLDKVAQQLFEFENKDKSKISKISKRVLDQYMEKMVFLTQNNDKLKDLIKKSSVKEANGIYSLLKKHFGKLNRDESIEFIKNILKDLK